MTPAGLPRRSKPGPRSTEAVHRAFGPDGYPRRLGGREDSVDLGAAFLLPPYAPTAHPDVVAAWQHGSAVPIRPAGGLAPGGSWRRDGVSWTNVVASYAMTAAAIGDRDTAVGWLTWLAAHRTANGSLPEKVLADGTPASVAPLAWTAAAVIITADTLTPPLISEPSARPSTGSGNRDPGSFSKRRLRMARAPRVCERRNGLPPSASRAVAREADKRLGCGFAMGEGRLHARRCGSRSPRHARRANRQSKTNM